MPNTRNTSGQSSKQGQDKVQSKGAAISTGRQTVRPGDKAGEAAKSNPTGGNQ